MTGTSGGPARAASGDRWTRMPRIPTRRAPSMSCAQAVAHHHRLRRRDAEQLQRRLEDARMRLQVAVLGRREGGGDQAVELEVLLERRQAAMRVRDQADLDAAGRQLPQHRRHVVIQEEVLAGRPFRVDLGRAGVEARPPLPPIPSMIRRV